MRQRTRDGIAIASLALSAAVAITGVAFWAGGIDKIARERVEDEVAELVPQPPLGTIVAFAGGDIPDGWALCAGQRIPDDNNLPDEFGDTMPNLTGRFLRASTDPNLTTGGVAAHAHRWARRGAGNRKGVWYSFNDQGVEDDVDTWNNGIDDDGKNVFPFIADEGATLYTSVESHLPPYMDIRYIMRIR